MDSNILEVNALESHSGWRIARFGKIELVQLDSSRHISQGEIFVVYIPYMPSAARV